MKIYRFSVSLIFVTVVALLYVHQQVELLKISYKLNSNETQTARLLDQNRALVYNITRLKSPVSLDRKFLAVKKDYTITGQWQVVKVTTPSQDKRAVTMAKTAKRSLGSLKIFGKPREAFANPVK